MSEKDDFPFDLNDLNLDKPDLVPGRPAPEIKPWEQRIGRGMGGSGTSGPGFAAPDEDAPPLPGRACQALDRDGLVQAIDQQTDLTHYPLVDQHTTPDTDLSLTAESDVQVWRWFLEEQLFDTRRVTLNHFHLFEWFPLTPGTFHTARAAQQRRTALDALAPIGEGDDQQTYFNPLGKASMLRGGVGAVRLRPRMVAGEPHYFMSAASGGVCHEGFPVLVPRRFYRSFKARLLAQGVVPVTLRGEMRYLPDETLPAFFKGRREVPRLYLHVDQLEILPAPRADVTSTLVSVAAAFAGTFAGQEGVYATYASFDPANSGELERIVRWMDETYVGAGHAGVMVTDFDEVRPRFPDVPFGLPDLMAGKLDMARVRAFLEEQGLDPDAGESFLVVYKEINTQGGAYIAGDVHVEGGDFIGRDVVIGD